MKQKNNSVSLGILFIRRNPRPNASLKDSFWRGLSGRAFGKSALVALLLSVSVISHSQIINTIAGNGKASFYGDGGPATAAELNMPGGVAVDASGNIYIADFANFVIREVNTSGTISTVAGVKGAGYSGDLGPATAAGLSDCAGVAVDGSGNIYISADVNDRIRKVNTAGIISTFAGTGTAGFSGDGGQATAADLNLPYGIAVDASGNVYIADEDNDCIRKVTASTGLITTIAGIGTSSGKTGNGGLATAAKLKTPTDVAVDASGNIYIADNGNEEIRIVTASNNLINIFAGTGTQSYSGDGGPAIAAELNSPTWVAVDASNNVYISDAQDRHVRIVNTSGIISSIAGNGSIGFTGDGGPAPLAEFSGTAGLVVNTSGNLYVVDMGNQRVREVTASFSILTSSTNISCNGTSTGTATAIPYDGTSAFTYSWTPGGATTSSVSGLSAGTYTITLIESGGTTATASVTITQPVALAVSASVTSATCSGMSNGSASATASNGTSPYTYSWSPGAKTTTSITGLSGGTYTVTVKDACSASATASVIIVASSVTATATQTASACIATSNGTASATASNGTTPYTYSWSPVGGTTSTGTGLSAGTYTVTVNDKCGVATTAAVTITQGAALTTINAYAITNVSCHGGNNGSATVTAIDGTSPFTYSWQGGTIIVPKTTATITGLMAATYTITVKDHCGTSIVGHVTITQPGLLTTGASALTGTCNGQSTGTAMASPSNGTSPYTYSWSGGGGTNSTASALGAGTYTITVQDSCGGSATASVAVTQPAALSATATLIAGAGCGATPLGSALATIDGGTTPYTYSWSPRGGTNATATGLSAGNYTVTVRDNCGASVTDAITIQPITVIAFAGANVSCYGGSNGQAKVSTSGGRAPYTYSWSPVTNSTYIAGGLSAGSYSVVLTDFNGCSATSAVTITQPTVLRDSVATINYPTCEVPVTTATIGVQGGTSPYRYTWSPNISTTNSATGLIARSYAVQVKDNNSCWNTINFSISQPPVLRDSIIKSSVVNASSCGNNGSAIVGAKYGSSPYTYSWSSGSTNASVVPSTGGTETFSYTGAIQHYTVPAGVTQITVNVTGASGGEYSTTSGGFGASFMSVCTVTPGHVLSVVVGGAGGNSTSGGAGGGGATWVYDSAGAIPGGVNHSGTPTLSALIAVAAGGGGDGHSSSTLGTSGGTDITFNATTTGGGSGSSPGGTNGNGGGGGNSMSGGNNIAGGAGGAGWISNGGTYNPSPDAIGGNDWDTSFASAAGYSTGSGGFGGGGGGSTNGGGGGGGYNGGGGGFTGGGGGGGGGGGSYFNTAYGTLIGSVTAANTGNGSVTISLPISGVAAGTYSVTVTDNCGASASTSVTINQIIRTALSAIAYTGGNVSCNGGSNGQAKVSATGGNPPYTYSWNSGSTTYIANGLSAGTYTVTVQDNCGTSATSSTTISQPALLVDSVASLNDPPCTGGTGNATIGVIGGTSPYRYTWSPNVSSTDSASGLTKRSYVVQVKDNNSCWNNITISITSCANPPTATYPKGIHSDKGNEATCCPTPDNINLYPNPNTGQFTLSGLQMGMILEMYDYTGKKISTSTVTNQAMQLNISQADGVYLIRIVDKDGNLISQKKVVKMQ